MPSLANEIDVRTLNKWMVFWRVRNELREEYYEQRRREAEVASEARRGLTDAKSDPALRAHLG